jgi:hypothetical protein
MAVCKTCGKEYHACGSCGLEDWEYTYCSSTCWDNDEVNIKNLKIVKDLVNSLTIEQVKALMDLIDYDSRGQMLLDNELEKALEKKKLC